MFNIITNALKRRLKSRRKIIAKNIKDNIKQFNTLKSINELNKKRTRKHFRALIKEVALLDLYAEMLESLCTSVYYGQLGATVIYVIDNVAKLLLIGNDNVNKVLYSGYSLIGEVIFALIILIPSLKIRKRFAYKYRKLGRLYSFTVDIIIILLYCYFISILAIPYNNKDTSFFGCVLIIGMVGAIIVWFNAQLYNVILAFVEQLHNRIRRTMYPNAIIAYKLLIVINSLERHKTQKLDLYDKQILLGSLEEIATCFQYSLPKRLKPEDVNTAICIRESFLKRATTIRILKQSLAMPTNTNEIELINKLSKYLIAIISENMSLIEETEPQALKNKQIFDMFVKPILVAILPSLFLGIIQNTSLAIKSSNVEYIKIIVVVWAVVGIMSIIDPLFKDKWATSKDIYQLIFGTKNKDTH